jgi:hypothetical protein
MTRVPIISRGYITEGGVSKIVLTAELPTLERYEISELGIYPSLSNPVAGDYDSKNLYTFLDSEYWEYVTSSASVGVPGNYGTIVDGSNSITVTDVAFQTNADNAAFENATRVARHERCRFFNNTIITAGNISTFSSTSPTLVPTTNTSHLRLAVSNLDFLDQVASDDKLKMAFTVINKTGSSTTDPLNVNILVQFSSSTDSTAEYANFDIKLAKGTGAGQWDYTNNRYVVASTTIGSMTKSTNFSWAGVKFVRIYTNVTPHSGGASSDYFVALDAIRFDNLSSYSPVYGLTAYTVMKTDSGLPIIKNTNSSNFVEFRFLMDVL